MIISTIRPTIHIEILAIYLIALLILTFSDVKARTDDILTNLITILCLLLLSHLHLVGYYITDCALHYVGFRQRALYSTSINYRIFLKTYTLSFLQSFLFTIIGLLVNLYYLAYFKTEEVGKQYIVVLNWFIFFAICFPLSNNFFTVFLG